MCMQAVPAQMTVAELKAALTAQGLMVKGTKKVLVARLEEAQGAANLLCPGQTFIAAI